MRRGTERRWERGRGRDVRIARGRNTRTKSKIHRERGKKGDREK